MMVVDCGSLDPSQDYLLLCLVVRAASTIVGSTNKDVSAAVVRGI